MYYQEHRDNAEYFRFGRCLCPPHFHRAIELIYCVRIEKPVIVGGEEMTLREGELLLVSPLTPHIFPPRKELLSLCVVMPVTYSDLWEQHVGAKQPTDPILHDTTLAKDIFDHLCMLEHCDLPILRQGIYTYVLGRLLAAYTFTEAKHSAATDFSVEVLRYIEKHYAKKLTAESVAAALGYNPCYFSSMFNRCFCTSFPAHLNALRIQKALALLGHAPTAAIAERVGYSTEQSFYRNFKKVTGRTPTEYRKMRTKQ